MSPATLEELAEVFQREKFDRYVTAAEREEFLEAFVERVVFIEPMEQMRVCRNTKDDKFLEVATSGGAIYLITGDSDLRSLHPFREVAIVDGGRVFDGHEWRRNPLPGRCSAPAGT